MRILVVRLTALGDVVLTTPALAALRRRHPDAEIDLCTSRPYAGLFRGHPALNRVIPFDRGSARALGRSWREQGYDVIVDLQHKVRTVYMSRVAKPARRLTLVKRGLGGALRSLFGFPLPSGIHTADRYVQVLAPLDVPALGADDRRLHLELSPAVKEHALGLLEDLGVGDSFVALVPGATHATKRWPAERFATLGRWIRAQGLGTPLAVGGPQDAAAVRESGLLATPLDIDLPALAAVLGRARAVVAADTGPMHLACAVGTPVVALFGPTDPTRWAPLGAAHRTLAPSLRCAPCSDHGGPRCPRGTHECMSGLDVGRVGESLRELLSA